MRTFTVLVGTLLSGEAVFVRKEPPAAQEAENCENFLAGLQDKESIKKVVATQEENAKKAGKTFIDDFCPQYVNLCQKYAVPDDWSDLYKKGFKSQNIEIKAKPAEVKEKADAYCSKGCSS